MSVMIRDPNFERKLDAERVRRDHKTMAKTLKELAAERLVEIEVGQFLKPSLPASGSDQSHSGRSETAA